MGAPDGGAAKFLAERCVIEVEQCGERTERRGGRQRRIACGLRLAVPGADVLADVAAERPGPERVAQRLVDVAAMLDREVGNATARIQHVRIDEGVGRT